MNKSKGFETNFFFTGSHLVTNCSGTGVSFYNFPQTKLFKNIFLLAIYLIFAIRELKSDIQSRGFGRNNITAEIRWQNNMD